MIDLKVTRKRMSLEDFSQGLSALACDKCGVHINRQDQENEALVFYSTDCLVCGYDIETREARLTILPAYQKFMQIREVEREEFWYHSTSLPEWKSAIDKTSRDKGSPLMVHLGTKEVALERAKDAGNDFLCKVRVLRSTYFGEIVEDDNHWPDFLQEMEHITISNKYQNGVSSPLDRGVDALRYVNRYEMPGNISLLVPSSRVDVVEQIVL